MVIEAEPIKKLWSETFHRIEVAVEKEEIVNLFCSSGIIQIDERRLALRKIIYFKDVIIVFDGLDEVVCHDYNKFFINARICSGKVLLPITHFNCKIKNGLFKRRTQIKNKI